MKSLGRGEQGAAPFPMRPPPRKQKIRVSDGARSGHFPQISAPTVVVEAIAEGRFEARRPLQQLAPARRRD
jgi:hypothetical protein